MEKVLDWFFVYFFRFCVIFHRIKKKIRLFSSWIHIRIFNADPDPGDFS